MNRIALTAALVAVGFVTGANAAFAGMTISGPQDSVDNEGLGVKYVPKMMRDVGALNCFAKKKRGKDGPPLLHLDWKTGADKVLTSDGYDGVGAIINGFIQFETEGTHRFAMETNDGTRITLGGQLILEDPDVHPGPVFRDCRCGSPRTRLVSGRDPVFRAQEHLDPASVDVGAGRRRIGHH